MKFSVLLVLSLLIASTLCGCPFGFLEKYMKNRPTYQNKKCADGQILIDGKCQHNDLKLSASSNSIRVSKDYQLEYEIPNDHSVDFLIKLNVKSWVGLGFNQDMKGADMVIANIDENNVVSIFEAYSPTETTPTEISDQSAIKLLGYKVTDDSVEVKFNRQLRPNIENTAQLEFNQQYVFIGAYSNPGVLEMTYHKTNHYQFFCTLQNSNVSVQ